MANLNKVFLIGNLTRDPELRQLPSGTALCSFGMAINRNINLASGEQREEVCYVDVVAMGRQAEVIAQYMHKGSPLFVEGRLHFEQWDDRETGKKRNRLSIRVEHSQFLGSPAGQGGAPQSGTYQNQGGYGQPMNQGGGYPSYSRPAAPQPNYGSAPQGGYGNPPPSYGNAQPNYGNGSSATPASMPVFRPLPDNPPSAMPSAGAPSGDASGEIVDDIPF